MHSPRLTGRDFKGPRQRPGLDLGRWREIGIGLLLGLAVGLVVTLVVYVKDRRQGMQSATENAPAPRKNPQAVKPIDPDAEAPVAKYDFYEMLPKFEVVVPEKDRDVRRDQPTAKIERPGVYVLQAGSYRNQEDADRVASQLGKQGVTATVQRVAVDADVWHRVRVGPINNLDQLNRLRAQLHKADIDALVIRVGD